MTLPKDWVWTTIGEITEPIQKVDPRENPEKVFIYLDISSIDNSIQKIVTPKQYIGVDAPSRARQLVRANDVLFSTVRTYLKNVALVPEYCDGQVASTGFSILRATPEAMGRFLFYYSQTEAFLTPLNELQRGTSYPAVRDSDVRVQQIPLPSLPEQERIVERIESLFTQLDAGVAGLKHAQAAFKRYKASVLKAACEGRLVPQDPSDEPAEELLRRVLVEKGEDYHVLEDDLPRLPEGWVWTTLSAVTKWIVDVDHKMPKTALTNIPYISTRDFIGNDEIDFENAKKISEIDFRNLCRKVKPEYQDILLSRYGTVGEIRKVKTHRDFQASYSIAIIKTINKIDITDYLVIVLRSDIVQKQISRDVRATAQPDLGLAHIRKFVIPLAPFKEQHRIITELEHRLSVVQELEQTIKANLKRAGRLHQAILKRAFEGRLS